ncbi:MAG TPA: RNA polymerase sigma factor [Candidatus Hydrogenedens sp.]|nr:RNA polymerase sigma factor [Candidatus Hydrogenedens sp.]
MINSENISSQSERVSDKELVEKVKKGDEQAFDIIIKRYYNMVFYMCCKKLSNKDIAREATQEVFIKAWKKIKTCSDGAYFISWLSKITKNHCVDILRKEITRKQRELSMDNIENIENISTDGSNDEAINNRIDIECLNAIIEQLPEPQRIVIQKKTEGYTTQEIADQLHCPLGTVLSRLSLGRNKIYQHIKRQNLSLEDFSGLT